jgi:hypothetical protein
MILILDYLKMRFNPMKFFSLAVLLSMFVFKKEDSFYSWLTGIGFLFLSFLVFRFLDDAGSVHFDRKNHLERYYLNTNNYKSFLIITGSIIFVCFVLLHIIFFKDVIVIYILVFGSILLYILFSRNSYILPLIPLIKYPLLLMVLNEVPLNFKSAGILLAAFFLMLSYDSLEKIFAGKNQFWKSFVFLLICGVLIFQPYERPWNILLVLFPMVVILTLIKKMYKISYLPLLFYPIAYFLTTNF